MTAFPVFTRMLSPTPCLTVRWISTFLHSASPLPVQVSDMFPCQEDSKSLQFIFILFVVSFWSVKLFMYISLKLFFKKMWKMGEKISQIPPNQRLSTI